MLPLNSFIFILFCFPSVEYSTHRYLLPGWRDVVAIGNKYAKKLFKDRKDEKANAIFVNSNIKERVMELKEQPGKTFGFSVELSLQQLFSTKSYKSTIIIVSTKQIQQRTANRTFAKIW